MNLIHSNENIPHYQDDLCKNDKQKDSSQKDAMKSQKKTFRAPLSSIDRNSFSKKYDITKKQSACDGLKKMTAKQSQLKNPLPSEEFDGIIEPQNGYDLQERQEKEENECLDESRDTNDATRIFRETVDDSFWSDHVSSLLSLRRANPVRDPDSDTEDEDENYEQSSSKTNILCMDDRIEDDFVFDF